MDNNSQTKSEFLDDSFMKEAEKTPVIKKRKLNKDAAPYDPSKFPINFDDIVKENLDPVNVSGIDDEFLSPGEEVIEEEVLEGDICETKNESVLLNIERCPNASVLSQVPQYAGEKQMRSTHRAVLTIKELMLSKLSQNVPEPSAGPSGCSPPISKINWPIRDHDELLRLENGVRAGDAGLEASLIKLFEQMGSKGSAKEFIMSIIKNIFSNARYTWTGRPPNNFKNAPKSHAAQNLRIMDILRNLTIQKFPGLDLDSVTKLIQSSLYNKNDLDRKNAAKRAADALLAEAAQETAEEEL